LFADEDLQERIEDACREVRLTLVGDNEHTSPAGALTFKITVLLKPLSAVRVTVEFPKEPALTVTLVGAAAILKSTVWNVIVTLRVRVALVLVTTTLLLPVVVWVQVRLTLAEVAPEVRLTLRALRLHEVPPFCARPTVPENPLMAVTRIVEAAEDPTLTIIPNGLATIVKSWTLIVKTAERMTVLLFPFTITV
jgi:hypothetical protein